MISFEACCLTGNLVPVPAPLKDKVISGPFLFTPILNPGSSSARSSCRTKVRSVTWVVGDTAEVNLQVRNCLGVEVKISNISLLYEGLELEVEPTTVLLDSHGANQVVVVRAVPRSVGNLRILGYSHTVLGVRSTCLLNQLPALTDQELIKVNTIK